MTTIIIARRTSKCCSIFIVISIERDFVSVLVLNLKDFGSPRPSIAGICFILWYVGSFAMITLILRRLAFTVCWVNLTNIAFAAHVVLCLLLHYNRSHPVRPTPRRNDATAMPALYSCSSTICDGSMFVSGTRLYCFISILGPINLVKNNNRVVRG